MEKTADLAMVQKTKLKPSTKRVSHRRSLLKGVAVQGVLGLAFIVMLMILSSIFLHGPVKHTKLRNLWNA